MARRQGLHTIFDGLRCVEAVEDMSEWLWWLSHILVHVRSLLAGKALVDDLGVLSDTQVRGSGSVAGSCGRVSLSSRACTQRNVRRRLKSVHTGSGRRVEGNAEGRAGRRCSSFFAKTAGNEQRERMSLSAPRNAEAPRLLEGLHESSPFDGGLLRPIQNIEVITLDFSKLSSRCFLWTLAPWYTAYLNFGSLSWTWTASSK